MSHRSSNRIPFSFITAHFPELFKLNPFLDALCKCFHAQFTSVLNALADYLSVVWISKHTSHEYPVDSELGGPDPSELLQNNSSVALRNWSTPRRC